MARLRSPRDIRRELRLPKLNNDLSRADRAKRQGENQEGRPPQTPSGSDQNGGAGDPTDERRVNLRAPPIGIRPLLDVALEVAPGTEAGPHGSLHEFLMERYTAFTESGSTRRRFHIWHRPWPQARCRVLRMETDILGATFSSLAGARFVGANHSAGVRDVWMIRPIRL